jgi:hypothetical protein
LLIFIQGSRETVERLQETRRRLQEETQLVEQLQYKKPQKKKVRKRPLNSNLHAFGVFTDQGIHISCAGCPIGWPEMLTVYPQYEVGIPVTCSNCPNNWPGALNLLGVGGEPTTQGGNNFFGFQADRNFGQDFAGVDRKFDSYGDAEGGGKNGKTTQFFIKFSTTEQKTDAAIIVTTNSNEVDVTTVEPSSESGTETEDEENSEGADNEVEKNS